MRTSGRTNFASYNATVLTLSKIIVEEENQRCKGEGLAYFTSIERQTFLVKWHVENEGYLQAQMGLGDSNSFLTGILFSTNVSLSTVPHLQKVIQADACHMHFSKHTLFSAYGSTANGSMAPVAFGILFGNENKESWGKFWKFVSFHHPSLNDSITIITDQDKGSIAAIKEYMPNAHQCSLVRWGKSYIRVFGTSSSSLDVSPLKTSNVRGKSIKTRCPPKS